MVNKDRNAISNIKKTLRPTTKKIKKTLRKDGFSKQKSVVRWNFEVNDLVKITYGENKIGLIICKTNLNFEMTYRIKNKLLEIAFKKNLKTASESIIRAFKSKI